MRIGFSLLDYADHLIYTGGLLRADSCSEPLYTNVIAPQSIPLLIVFLKTMIATKDNDNNDDNSI